ncbi:bifunctional adenosylcobinamide kinase/adenosylcobinamide-phosphate guanylyltransferase [bacterium]|nr:bifunctional adenosylcobinamide kinase/adenosylcobinamide-phosphate guanylyltransferase [bacterium]MBU1958344.1 bifunctional adenosylcobinamide kinase/adenosylcobinamide-phosphate guanylyltransferase [bacterium]
MKILYYGGQKSGKSLLAEQKTLQISPDTKPCYIATYINNYGDSEMQERVSRHQAQRQKKFITIEEPFNLTKVIEAEQTYLVDCISMWILNTLDIEIEELFEQLDTLFSKNANIVFVLNDVHSGVIPMDEESRQFVDRSGIIGQKLALRCDEVYEVKLGIARRLK